MFILIAILVIIGAFALYVAKKPATFSVSRSVDDLKSRIESNGV